VIVTQTAGTRDTLGRTTTTPTDTTTKCRFDPRGRSSVAGEERTGSYTVTEADALVHLPYGTQVALADQIRITHRFGELLAPPLVYEVAGPAELGALDTAVVLNQVST